MRSILFFLVAGLLLAPQVGEACELVNGKDVAGATTINVGDYIEIGDGVTCGNPQPVCFGETLSTCYTVTIATSSCGGGGLVTSAVAGNNLSGTYQVDSKSGDCLKLCACP